MALYDNDPDELTEEERRLLQEAESSQGAYAGGGAAAGSLIGAGLGAATGLFTAGATTLPGASLGASLGGGLGGAIGNWLGGDKAKAAEARLAQLKEERLRKLEENNKGSTVQSLLSPWLTTRGM
jgi:phage tail tape-measure protein